MGKRLLDYDPLTKTRQYLHSSSDGEYVIESVQDAEDVLEFNHRAANVLDKKQDWWFIGSIPIQLCQQWAQEAGVKVYSKEWMVTAKKKVQLPEFRKLNPNNIKL